jgi:transposase
MRYELSDDEWATIRPMLPNKARGVPRVDDRRVLNGIFWVLRSGAPWRDLPTPLRSLHHLLQPLCALATRRGLEPDHGRARRCP